MRFWKVWQATSHSHSKLPRSR